MTTLEIEVSIECDECGKTLEWSSRLSRYGFVTICVNPCSKCMDDAENDGIKWQKEQP